jgi:hypothetical protein
MERIHPKVSYVAACAMIALALGVGGCRSSSSGVAGNPFMSPDRVPPPNTRALLPGQAQPYYQGDPLPAMQSATNPPATAIAALPNEADSRSSSGRTLAWAQPGSAAPAPTPASIAPLGPAAPQPIAAANEAAVAVPTDGNPLRFPLPAPREPEAIAPVAATVPTPAASHPIQPIAAQQPAGVQLASFNAPVASAYQTPVSVPTMTPPQQVASPWRSPQVVQATPPLAAYTPQPVAAQPYGVSPVAPPASPAIPVNIVAATLRAVESPPQPGDPIPRIRVPGYVAAQTSADGFRPRTSMQ